MPFKDYDKQRKYTALWKRRKNLENSKKVFTLLGNKCKFCGNEDSRVLEIDHIVPLLRKARNDYSRRDGGSNIKQLIASGKQSLDNLQLLCANCHRIKTHEDRLQYPRYIKDLCVE